ncbi:MAG: alanine:cation symporter family protein [Wolbachia sp.]
MIAPFVDTILVSFLTGIVIIITGMYSTNKIDDITLVSSAFLTALLLFSKLALPLTMFSFAFSTIIAYYYYCEVALLYLFGNKKVLILFQVLIVSSVYISCISKNIEFISYLGDSLFVCLMIPNAVAIYLLRRKVLNTINSYYKRY